MVLYLPVPCLYSAPSQIFLTFTLNHCWKLHMPGTRNNTRHEQTNKVEHGLTHRLTQTAVHHILWKSRRHTRVLLMKLRRAVPADHGMTVQQSTVEYNQQPPTLHHQELSVFISANKFLGNPPDDFYSNLYTHRGFYLPLQKERAHG